MADALIGYTGFVGSTLARERDFAARFNSRNIGEIDGQDFDTVVCAGVSAVKWLANKEPEADRLAIEGLKAHLARVRARRFVLVSTIDVYREPVGVTEADAPPTEGLHPYGLHRLALERWVAERFETHVIVRLPGLFGAGLRKNLIFDMLNGNQTEKIAPGGVLQWYPMRRFAGDLARIEAAGAGLVNVAVAPVGTEAIRARFFPEVRIGAAGMAAPRYDMWTEQAALLGGSGRYHIGADEVMDELGRFIAAERAA